MEGEKDIGRKRREWEWKRGRENGRGETRSGYFFSWKKSRVKRGVGGKVRKRAIDA